MLLALLHCAASSIPPLPALDDPDYESKLIAVDHRDEPTPERPRIGCIYPTPDEQARVEGKLLPEIVRVIGRTSDADGARWKVLRAGEFDAKRWQPWPQEKIHFSGCGPEIRAYAAESYR